MDEFQAMRPSVRARRERQARRIKRIDAIGGTLVAVAAGSMGALLIALASDMAVSNDKIIVLSLVFAVSAVVVAVLDRVKRHIKQQ